MSIFDYNFPGWHLLVQSQQWKHQTICGGKLSWKLEAINYVCKTLHFRCSSGL